VFLAAVAEDAMSNSQVASAEVIGYLLVRKLLAFIGWLEAIMAGKTFLPGTHNWEEVTKERDFKDIRQYIGKEHEVFKSFHKSMYSRVAGKA